MFWTGNACDSGVFTVFMEATRADTVEITVDTASTANVESAANLNPFFSFD